MKNDHESDFPRSSTAIMSSTAAKRGASAREEDQNPKNLDRRLAATYRKLFILSAHSTHGGTHTSNLGDLEVQVDSIKYRNLVQSSLWLNFEQFQNLRGGWYLQYSGTSRSLHHLLMAHRSLKMPGVTHFSQASPTCYMVTNIS